MEYDATIVTGHGRCGSSLVMQMLEAGGVPVRGAYPAFEDPSYQGKELRDGRAWKCLDIQIPQLAPKRGNYRWILCTRNHREQAASQIKFAQFFGMPLLDDPSAKQKLIKSYENDTPKLGGLIRTWGGPVLHIQFEEILARPNDVAVALSRFGFKDFDVEAAASVVRTRSPECYPTMMEVELMQSRAF